MSDRLHVYRGENLAVCGAEVPDVCPECAAGAEPVSEPVPDEVMAERVMSLVNDPGWLERADLAAWTRVVRSVRRAALAHPVTPEYGGALANQQFAEPGLDAIRSILEEVRVELARARAKFGPMASGHEAQSVIGEEFHEFTLAVWFGVDQRGQPADPRAEAVQLAAMAVRYILDVAALTPSPEEE